MKLFIFAIALVPAVLVGCASPVELRHQVQAGRISCIASEKMIITHEQAQGINDGSWVTVCPESLWLCGQIAEDFVGNPYFINGPPTCTKMESIPTP